MQKFPYVAEIKKHVGGTHSICLSITQHPRKVPECTGITNGVSMLSTCTQCSLKAKPNVA